MNETRQIARIIITTSVGVASLVILARIGYVGKVPLAEAILWPMMVIAMSAIAASDSYDYVKRKLEFKHNIGCAAAELERANRLFAEHTAATHQAAEAINSREMNAEERVSFQ